MVEVVLALEEKFGIEISDDQIAGVKTVGEAADLVISKQTAVG
ncbi:MAG: phosphopantetheine-binding protein [Acidimicrobiia bacterium]